MPAPKLKGARKQTQYRARNADPSILNASFDRSHSRLKGNEARMQTYDDVMSLGGDEDTFHLNRDKMLLDGDDEGGYDTRYAVNGGHDDDSLDEADEIYSLPSHITARRSSPSPSLPSEASDDDEEPQPRKKKERKEKKKEDLSVKGRFGHEYDPKQDVVFPSSDESGSDGEEEEEDEPSAGATGADQRSDMGSDKDAGSDDDSLAGDDRWAAAQYHATKRAPGEADSDDDEAAELELEEARRLQRKARERLVGGDFGVEEEEEEEDKEEGGRKRGRLEDEEDEEDVVQLTTKKPSEEKATSAGAADLSEPEAIALLLRTSPETLALVDDFVLTASKIKQVENDLEVVRKGDGKGGEHPALAVMELEHQALSTYLPTLAFYFSLLLTPLPSRSPSHDELVETVLKRLSSLRQSLATMEELELTSASYGAEDEDDGEEDDVAALARSDSEEFDREEEVDLPASLLSGLSDAEVEQLLSGLGPQDGVEELMKRVKERRREKGLPPSVEEGEDEEMLDDDGEEEDEEDEPLPVTTKKQGKKAVATATPISTKRAHRSQPISIPTLAPLSSKPSSSKPSSRPSASSAASDLLDPLSLSHSDVLDKKAQKHSLRFHVSQVAQKAAKREARSRQGLEGDEEAPRRSKEQQRRAVLQRQEHGAAKDAKKASRLDGEEFGEEDRRAARAVRGEGEGGDGEEGEGEDYYDLVSMEKEEGRRAKKARYDEKREEERAELYALSTSTADGPRQASRQILANKGLTPKRKKENRNARVKKRIRYDKAQKKLGSMQATYRGGESRMGYEGEKGGIVGRNVKSRRLG